MFNDAVVKRLDIVITEAHWDSMLANMVDLYGASGSSGGKPVVGRPEGGRPDMGEPEVGDNQGNQGELADVEDPIFVPAELFYTNRQWYKVGVRFKGNSSLQSSWGQGILKLSFKLDFDEFEDDFPQFTDQRFYGFKKLSLKNNYGDKSFMREKVASEIYQKAGLPVSRTAFYSLYVDHGNGPEYFGLYTLVEEVDNTVIKTQFSDNNGNLYKPENSGADFVAGTFSETGFEKKTNEAKGDWSDIKSLFSALHNTTRTSDPGTWRSGMDAVFETDAFITYLAITTVIQNWDSYGLRAHNYYLYNKPENSKLTWIPWDLNEALQDGKKGEALLLDFSNIQCGNWPLIEYIYVDTVYRARYNEFVKKTADLYFNENTTHSIISTYSALIAPYATTEVQGYTFLTNSSDFQTAASALKQQVTDRHSAVSSYLNTITEN